MIKVGHSSIILCKEDGNIGGLEGTMKSFQINGKFQPKVSNFHSTINLEGLSVRGKLPILTLQLLTINTKVDE